MDQTGQYQLFYIHRPAARRRQIIGAAAGERQREASTEVNDPARRPDEMCSARIFTHNNAKAGTATHRKANRQQLGRSFTKALPHLLKLTTTRP
jgi:hypothetical protein